MTHNREERSGVAGDTRHVTFPAGEGSSGIPSGVAALSARFISEEGLSQTRGGDDDCHRRGLQPRQAQRQQRDIEFGSVAVVVVRAFGSLFVIMPVIVPVLVPVVMIVVADAALAGAATRPRSESFDEAREDGWRDKEG